MKKIANQVILIALALAFLGQSQPAGKTSVAVYPIKAVGSVDKSLTATLSSLLGYELGQSSQLIVLDESMLKAVMERQAMNISDLCDDTVCQVEIGKLVKAQKMAVGELSKLGERYILTVKLIDIQSGAMETTTKDECYCSEGQLDKLVAVAGAKIRNHLGDPVPIPALPGDQAFLLVQPSTPEPQVPTPVRPAFVPVQRPAPQPGEFYPPNTKGGPMVLVKDFNFYMDKYEVTNQDYQECVAAGVCPENKKYDGFISADQPVVGVELNDAITYCEWANKRLPTEKEWLQAAYGSDVRKYPWGNNKPYCELANYKECNINKTVPVQSLPKGASPYGAMNMADNVSEIIDTNLGFIGGNYTYGERLLSNFMSMNYMYKIPIAGHMSGKIIQGTNFSKQQYIGFRCARD